MLGRLWLHEPTSADVARAAELPGFPDVPPDVLAVEYANLFLNGVPPYGSVFTDTDGELGGEEALYADSVFHTAGFEPLELRDVAGADHLGLGLLYLADVAAPQPEFRSRFSSWATVCCVAVLREPGGHPFYLALARRTLRVLDGPVDATGWQPGPVGAAPESGDAGLREMMDFFLTPLSCGMFLSRARLGHIGLQLGLRLPFGTRRDVCGWLFSAAGDAGRAAELVRALMLEMDAWDAEYHAAIALQQESAIWTWREGLQRSREVAGRMLEVAAAARDCDAHASNTSRSSDVSPDPG